PLFVPADPGVPGSKNKLIVQPGGVTAQLVALDSENGGIVWQSSGEGKEAAYTSPICATFFGKTQIITYDQDTLGGYDCETGRRLWELKPPKRGDFNVPTPVVIGERLLLSTENNGTRLYEFDTTGRIQPEPVAKNNDLSPDSATAVFLKDTLYGICGSLFCLNRNTLDTEAVLDDDAFTDHATLIAGKTLSGKKRLLVAGMNGDVVLIDVDEKTPKLAGRIPAKRVDATLLAHPAVVGDRLYVRSVTEIRCYQMKANDQSGDFPR
ncbi:MAG: PQQ-like beta-propeller repeat protein, partial [Planctomycetaceae bacterium]|nr:PQQ-like beta-propeller repeat protein [Planctomycetaceae bacterium]